MKKLSQLILKHKMVILIVFISLFVINSFFISHIKVNYNLSDYLPKDTPSLKAAGEVIKSYDDSIPNIKLMIPSISITEALDYKNEIMNIEGVKIVLWADNYFNLLDPNVDKSKLNDWYKNNNALFLISIGPDDRLEVINQIKDVVKDSSLLAGDAVDTAVVQNNIMNEMNKIMLFVVPIILIILLLTTSSWFEPLLFLVAIGIAIVINMGSNIIMGEISFVTQSAAAILQLAVSMDYAIFLLHRFATLRHEGNSVEISMERAIKDSTKVILASALTTILGFAALAVMKFGIGVDLGIVLAKGVIFSLLSILFLLPILVVYTYKIIDKTHHKSFIPTFNWFSKIILKGRYVITALVVLLIVPSFIASQNNKFLYGTGGINSESTQVYKDTIAIDKEFGINNQMVLLIPNEDKMKEAKIVSDLQKLKHVISVDSFVTTFGLNAPIEYLPTEVVSQFISDKYSRIIIKTDALEEGETTFKLIDEIKEITNSIYKDKYYLTGASPINYDMKQIVTNDNLIVNVIAIAFILLVLIVTFKSFVTPLILVISIETAIWINLSIAYLSGSELNYIGYLIISTVQLGSTVDYAILFTKKYLNRKDNSDNKQAVVDTINETTPSILSSAFILAIAGYGLGLISSSKVISQLGILIGRGALISALIVLIFLPSTFIILGNRMKNKD